MSLVSLLYNADMIPYSTSTMMEPSVTFWGAAQSVTGSMHLVEVGAHRLLLDCGMVRGRRDESRLRNARFPFDPAGLDAVILSHAHTDHCGNLPNLIRQGFRGPIYCTPATRDLAAIMLADSGRIHEEDAAIAGIVQPASAEEGAPLYTRGDARRVIDHCIPVPYEQTFPIGDQVQLRFVDAGHILGSAVTVLTFTQAGHQRRLTFTGDLGRRGVPFLRPPPLVPAADLIISESTYGGRRHDTLEAMAAKMAAVVRGVLARGGKLLIPAFSLGRTQVVLHFLQRWMRDGVVPRLPIYVDSPLAAEIAEVYRRYNDAFEQLPAAGLPPVHYCRSPEEAREVSVLAEPCVLVASGGMCDGGRILQHLRLHLDDPRCSIVLVSYQAPHSLGAQLLQLRPTVRFHGRNWNKWAEAVSISGFSGHADHDDFLALLGPAAAETGKVRLVHGELPQAEALAADLRRVGFADVAIPHREELVKVA
jgi:metallo-beta-lactamase family protein